MSDPAAAEMAPVSRETRSMIVGGDTPAAPYPIQLRGVVTKGFGRGARELGIPTGECDRPSLASTIAMEIRPDPGLANLPDSSLPPLSDLHLTGIFYGFARVHPSTSTPLPTPSVSRSTSSTALPQTALSAETISSLPTKTAPYPPDSLGETAAPKRLNSDDAQVWPMVMSVGWNPYYKNEKITAVSGPASFSERPPPLSVQAAQDVIS